MLQKDVVVAEIKRLKAMKRAAILADADDVIDLHMRIAFANMDDFVEFGREDVPLIEQGKAAMYEDEDTGMTAPIMRTINTVRFKESDQVDGQLISEVKQGRDGASVKLVDRHKSIDFLERFFEMNPAHKHKKLFDAARLRIEKNRLKLEQEKAKRAAAEDEIKEVRIVFDGEDMEGMAE
jgi:phage terminase small subunit